MIILYFIVSLIYASTFTAWMQSNKGDERYWNKYSWSEPDWKGEYIALILLGFFFWPLVILFIIFYKIALNFFSKKAK